MTHIAATDSQATRDSANKQETEEKVANKPKYDGKSAPDIIKEAVAKRAKRGRSTSTSRPIPASPRSPACQVNSEVKCSTSKPLKGEDNFEVETKRFPNTDLQQQSVNRLFRAFSREKSVCRETDGNVQKPSRSRSEPRTRSGPASPSPQRKKQKQPNQGRNRTRKSPSDTPASKDQQSNPAQLSDPTTRGSGQVKKEGGKVVIKNKVPRNNKERQSRPQTANKGEANKKSHTEGEIKHDTHEAALARFGNSQKKKPIVSKLEQKGSLRKKEIILPRKQTGSLIEKPSNLVKEKKVPDENTEGPLTENGEIPQTKTNTRKYLSATAMDEEGVVKESISAKEVIQQFESKHSESETSKDVLEIKSGERKPYI